MDSPTVQDLKTREPEWLLGCETCGQRFPLGPQMSGCPDCRQQDRCGMLEAVFEPRLPPVSPANRAAGRVGLGRFLDLLPRCGNREWISLGEGGTPLIKSRSIGPRLGLRHLYFKNETVNPTWSFKDRYVAVTINAAVEFGYRSFVVSSTGNLGVSVAAYAAAAEARCVILAPDSVSPSLIEQATTYGARLVLVEDSARRELFESISGRPGWFPVGLFLPRTVQNPFGVEGYKTFAYEMVEDLGDAPAAVLFPCARGNGLYGAWKGFREAMEWRWTKRMPAMVACQPVGANSLEVTLERGLEHALELPRVQSVAVSTSEAIASDHALYAIRKSGGHALSASDPEILDAVCQLGAEGLFVEASSALPVACLPRLLERGTIDPHEPIVCILTAAGVKWTTGSARATCDAASVTKETSDIEGLLKAFRVT